MLIEKFDTSKQAVPLAHTVVKLHKTAKYPSEQ